MAVTPERAAAIAKHVCRDPVEPGQKLALDDDDLRSPSECLEKHDRGEILGLRPVGQAAEDGAKLFAARYHPNTERPPKMEMLSIIEQDENFRPISHIRADSATWDEGGRQWALESDPAKQKQLIDDLQRAHLDNVTYVPLGMYQPAIIYRKELSGIIPAPAIFYWNIKKKS